MPVAQRQQTLEAAIRGAGVVGAGGAGFPTYAKLRAQVDVVLGNGAECEPLLRVDQGLMIHQAAEVSRGLEIAAEATGADHLLVGLKAKHAEAAAALEAAGVAVERLPDFYPVGDEHVLVYEVLRRLVPQAGLPLQAGVVVQNIETLINIARAVEGEPVVDTWLSVLGEVAAGREVRLPIGTSVREVLELAGGVTARPFAVIDGGPMMGRLVADLDEPLTKTTKALLVLPERHPLVEIKRMGAAPAPRALRITQAACCQCHICTDLCPRNLLGHDIAPDRSVANLHLDRGDEALLCSAALCSQCNLCGYFACPLRLQPNEIHAHVKRTLSELDRPPYQPDVRVTMAPEYRDLRRVPSKRLVQRLWLTQYERPLRWDPAPHEPARVVVRLRQHVGAPAVAHVRAGDRVTRGDRIADVPAERLGTPIHAPLSGRVTAVDANEVTISA